MQSQTQPPTKFLMPDDPNWCAGAQIMRTWSVSERRPIREAAAKRRWMSHHRHRSDHRGMTGSQRRTSRENLIAFLKPYAIPHATFPRTTRIHAWPGSRTGDRPMILRRFIPAYVSCESQRIWWRAHMAMFWQTAAEPFRTSARRMKRERCALDNQRSSRSAIAFTESQTAAAIEITTTAMTT